MPALVAALALVTLAPSARAAVIAKLDIKPGVCPNPFHPTTNPLATLNVAVLGTPAFDPALVDVSTVTIRRSDGVGGEVPPIASSLEDVGTPFGGPLCACHSLGGDGIVDLLLSFQRTAMQEVLELDGVFDPIVADLDGDGIVGIGDLLWMLRAWAPDRKGPAPRTSTTTAAFTSPTW